MIKYLVKKKVEKEAIKKAKKAKRLLIYTGAAVVGVGAYLGYKKMTQRDEDEEYDDINYLNESSLDIDYDDCDQPDEEKYASEFVFKTQVDEDSIEEKIEEINSRRLSSENENSEPDKNIDDYIDSIEDSKKDIEVKDEDYKVDEYDKYEDLDE